MGIWAGNGSCHGEPSMLDPPVFGWQPYVPKALREARSSLDKSSNSLGSTRSTGGRSSPSGTSKVHVDLPDIYGGKFIYPPTPAFLRSFLSNTHDFSRSPDSSPKGVDRL